MEQWNGIVEWLLELALTGLGHFPALLKDVV